MRFNITGYSVKDFYENFIYTSHGFKPEIEWKEDNFINKQLYHQTLNQLEKENRLVNMFYHSKEFMKI